MRALDNNHDEVLYMSFRPVINDIAVLRPDSMALFPKLTELFWSYAHGDLWRESVFFMHRGIKKFSLMLWLGEPGGQDTILQYFEHIAMRMPHLQSFNLNLCPYDATAESQAHIGPALSWLLPKLRFLTALTLPPMVDAYSVISSTASLPNLETINANIDVTIDRSLFSVSAPSPPTSNVTLSRSLQSLSLGISYAEATTRLLCTEFPVLTKLSLWSHKPESQISTRTLTRAIALHCKSLRDISLVADALDAPADGLDLLTDGRITLADIQPLFGCRSVVRFSITHVLPLQLTNNDIRNLLENWGTVVDISLNHSPSRVLPPDAFEIIFRLGNSSRCRRAWRTPGASGSPSQWFCEKSSLRGHDINAQIKATERRNFENSLYNEGCAGSRSVSQPFSHPSVSATVLLQVPRPYGVGYPIRITRVFHSGEDGRTGVR